MEGEVRLESEQQSWFERYPKTTLLMMVILIAAVLYGLFSIRWVQNDANGRHKTNLKTLIHQYHAAQVIDNNVGRFILLREHRPNHIKWDRPSKNYIKQVSNGSLKRQHYRLATDENGFILPSGEHAAPDHKVVFLGGSTTECFYVAEESRFPNVVGRLLSQDTPKKINTYNGGVSANDTLHSLNALLNKVIPLQPDVVVLMENVNDLAVLRSQGTYWYTDSVKSHVQTGKNIFTRTELPLKDSPALSDAALITAFEKNLQAFVALCKVYGIKPVLMTQANRVDNDPLYHDFNETIRAFVKQGVTVVDLDNVIPATSEYLYDHYHYTDHGSLCAAEHIAEALAPLFG